METMVSGRINGMEIMVSTQEIMVSGGPGIRVCASKLVQCIGHLRLILFCMKLSIGIYIVAPIYSVNWRPTLVLK